MANFTKPKHEKDNQKCYEAVHDSKEWEHKDPCDDT